MNSPALAKGSTLYDELVRELGIDVAMDRESCEHLASLAPLSHPGDAFSAFTPGKAFAVIGPDDPQLGHPKVRSCKYVMVADSAISVYFHDSGGIPDIIVSDMDGDMRLILDCISRGSTGIIHAHGDNIPLVRKYSQLFRGTVVGSCQVTEHPSIILAPGGFTDGDRAAYLADYLGASEIVLTGFSFNKPVDKPDSDQSRKRVKLKWARIYLDVLARRRGHELSDGEIIRI